MSDQEFKLTPNTSKSTIFILQNPSSMKNLIYGAVMLLLFAACDPVIFPEAQPGKVKALKEIPEVLHGIYLDENDDSLMVYDQWFYYEGDEFSGSHTRYLSDSVELKYYRERYFYNARIKIGEEFFWILYMIHSIDSGHTLDLYTMDPGDIVKLAKLQEITSKDRDIESEGVEYYLFAPRKRHYKKIISDSIFTKMNSFRKLGK